jgi:nucleotide-binding universal stress UspA family protein
MVRAAPPAVCWNLGKLSLSGPPAPVTATAPAGSFGASTLPAGSFAGSALAMKLAGAAVALAVSIGGAIGVYVALRSEEDSAQPVAAKEDTLSMPAAEPHVAKTDGPAVVLASATGGPERLQTERIAAGLAGRAEAAQPHVAAELPCVTDAAPGEDMARLVAPTAQREPIQASAMASESQRQQPLDRAAQAEAEPILLFSTHTGGAGTWHIVRPAAATDRKPKPDEPADR